VVNYKLDFSDEGKLSFSSLDKAVAQRILNKLKWLTQNIDSILPLPLKRKYEGLFKLRIGDWRVIYDINHGQKMITIHKAGHRSEIYK
jgi:mRNA interferase RelE/StbE